MDVSTRVAYPELFRAFIENGLDTLLAQMPAAEQTDAPSPPATLLACGMEILRFAIQLPHVWPKTYQLLLRLSPHMEQRGRWSEWVPYLTTGLVMAETLQDARGLATLELWHARFQRAQGHYTDARAGLQRSADLFRAMGDMLHYAQARNLLAWTERLAGNREAAIRWAEEALRCITDETRSARTERGRSYAILGGIAYDQGAWLQAEAYFRQALATPAWIDDPARLAWGHADLGLALAAQGKLAEALAHYQTALEGVQHLEAPVQVATLQMNLAGIHLRLHEPAQALDLCQAAGALFQQVQDYRRLIMAEINLGIAHLQLTQLDEARQLLLRAGERAERLGYPTLRFSALYQLGVVYLNHGQPQEAQTILQRALALLEQEAPSPALEANRAEVHKRLAQAQQELRGVAAS